MSYELNKQIDRLLERKRIQERRACRVVVALMVVSVPVLVWQAWRLLGG